jgi:hypothetical protein
MTVVRSFVLSGNPKLEEAEWKLEEILKNRLCPPGNGSATNCMCCAAVRDVIGNTLPKNDAEFLKEYCRRFGHEFLEMLDNRQCRKCRIVEPLL